MIRIVDHISRRPGGSVSRPRVDFTFAWIITPHETQLRIDFNFCMGISNPMRGSASPDFSSYARLDPIVSTKM